jgi:hypothetical protein
MTVHSAKQEFARRLIFTRAAVEPDAPHFKAMALAKLAEVEGGAVDQIFVEKLCALGKELRVDGRQLVAFIVAMGF